LYEEAGFASIRSGLQNRRPTGIQRLDHAYFQGEAPCTMLIETVEAIWAPIDERDDWSGFERKLRDIAAMREAHAFAASRYWTPA
jgi:hypothetical protein